MRRIRLPELVWSATLLSLAAIHLLVAAWAAFDQASFAQSLAPFGAPNGHLIDDYAAASATFAFGFCLALLRPWRTPILIMALIWTALHTCSHVVVASQSGLTGPIEALGLGATTLMLLTLVYVSTQEDATARASCAPGATTSDT